MRIEEVVLYSEMGDDRKNTVKEGGIIRRGILLIGVEL
jgi:hypothetical protein